jgi:hypothetical protein
MALKKQIALPKGTTYPADFIELYAGFDLDDGVVLHTDRAALKSLVKKAGLFIHKPDVGTGVIVINQNRRRLPNR